jgi:hypothetical protein
MHATCPNHPTLLELITLIILGEDYNYRAPHCTVFFSIPLLHTFLENTSLSTPFLNALICLLPLT